MQDLPPAMSIAHAPSAPSAAMPDSSAVRTPFERWPHDRTQTGLVSDDAATRMFALTMAMQPQAPVDNWAHELVRCAELSRADPIALQVVATLLSMLKTSAAQEAALPCLVAMAAVDKPLPVRVATAHCFWSYKAVPAQAWPAVSQMVFSDNAGLRTVAFAAAMPHAEAGAGEIAAMAAKVGADGWTTEGLDLLASSAGKSEPKQRQIEGYVLRTLQGQTNVPVMIAGYSALSRLNPKGPGVAALVQVAGTAPAISDALLALTALGQLEAQARAAVPALVKQLVETNDPEREEALCRTLLKLQISEREVPIARLLQRLETGPDKSVIAHCILLALYAKPFARVAPVVAARYAKSSDELKAVLDPVHELLTGKRLVAPAPVNKT